MSLLVGLAPTISAETWMTSTSWTRNQHIRTAQITYSASQASVARFATEHYDLLINPSGAFFDTVNAINDNTKIIRYMLITSYRRNTSDEGDDLDSVASNRGWDDSLYYVWVETDGVAIKSFPSVTDTAHMVVGDSVFYRGWGSLRLAADFRQSQTAAYFRWKAFHKMGTDCDGVMEDEAHYFRGWNHMCFPVSGDKWVNNTSVSNTQGWGGYTYSEVMDSSIKLRYDTATNTGWLKDLVDTLHAENKGYFPNVTVYQLMDTTDDYWMTVRDVGGGGVFFENACSPIVYSWNAQAWEWMDSIVSWDTGYAVIWTTIFDGNPPNNEVENLGSLERCQLERLVFYYMAAVPERFFFKLTGNANEHYAGNFRVYDTAFKWFDAIDYDIGYPDSARWVDASGTDGAGQGFSLYRRDYTKSDGTDVIMLYRPKAGGNYGSGSAVNCDLGGSYRTLNADGTLGAVVTSTTIRNVEGKILISEGGPTLDSIPPAKIEDLGCEPGSSHGEIFLTWTATGDDSTTGTATRYEILYSQSLIDPVLFEAEDTVSSPPIPLPADTSQSFTISGLMPGGQYYAAIRAFDNAGNPSEVSLFNREFAGGIRPPDPITAEVDSSAGSAILTASMIESYYPSLSYQFAVDTNIAFPTPLVTDGITDDPSVSAVFNDLSSEQGYFWRCRAVAQSLADSSDWFDPPAYFTLESGTTGYLTKSHLLTPVEGELVQQNPPQFIVSVVPYVTAIFFQVDSDSTFGSPISSGPIPALADRQTIWSPSDSLEMMSSLWWRASSNGITWAGPVQFVIEPDLSTGFQSEAMTYAFPNPFRPAEDQTVTFANVPPGASLVILSTSGSVVRRWTNAIAGVITWDGSNASGRAVASGVYLWFVEGSNRKGKLLVVR